MEVTFKCLNCSSKIIRTKRQVQKAKSKGYKNVFCNNKCQAQYRSNTVRNKILNAGEQTCNICLDTKNLKEFNKNKTKPSGYNTICRKCSNKASKKYYNKNTEKHKKAVKTRREKIFKNNRQKIWNYLLNNPCIDCGEKDPVVLEFDHINPNNKKFTISQGFASGLGWDVLSEEIKKCNVRCSNCHRRRTAKQFGWYKNIL